jgi:hypothetical protein
MPLPIAHPAAVLPLRRFCPKHLSFSALVVGSFAPDLGYAVDDLTTYTNTVTLVFGRFASNFESVKSNWDWDDLTHNFLSSILFCLPVGLLALGLFNKLRLSLIETLPNPHRDSLRPLCNGKHTAIATISSLCIGIWLHIAWDSCTNSGKWLYRHLPALHTNLFNLGTTKIEIHRVLWLISTIGGAAALTVAYLSFLRRTKTNSNTPTQNERKRYWLWTMVLLLPVFIAVSITSFQERIGLSIRDVFLFLHRFLANYLMCLVAGIVSISFCLKRKLLQFHDNA